MIIDTSDISLAATVTPISHLHSANELKVKQSRYRPGVAQRVPGS